MAKHLTAMQEAELSMLLKRIRLTVQFMNSLSNTRDADGFLEIAATAAEKRSLRNLKIIARELDITVRMLPEDLRTSLDAQLSSQLAIDLTAEEDALRKRVTRALRRGHVASEVERRVLEDYADSLRLKHSDDHTDVVAIERLLRGGGELPPEPGP
ncbi:MAG: hypothetical protein MUF00_14575 [Gemmatimonadaceae bacterium]|jgi:H2-forming N5,N10-methylenetetrahydromethanopterin dehydrogenase-like enzyme|nr:hypothetical protein [Gemmatimonadaceae bacterium]